MKNYVKLVENECYMILLSKLDGRTYLYNKSTGEIKLRPYWE